ncbi:MAG: hypothetical protein GOU97_01195 [Nanoarchaeota archaeon]|nr:hypothetical protein [Nanoarchaeota archaeon]
MKTLFVEARDKTDYAFIVKKHLNKIKEKKLGLVCTVQHLTEVGKVKKILENAGKKVSTAKGKKTVYECQVLGCDVIAGEKTKRSVSAFVYLGGGEFHPLMLAEKTGRKVYCLRPSGRLDVICQEKVRVWVKKKMLVAAKASKEHVFGVLVSTKKGQQAMRKAESIVKKLRSTGRQAFVFVGDELSPRFLNDFSGVGAWINTACPRIVEDFASYDQPITNWEYFKKFL